MTNIEIVLKLPEQSEGKSMVNKTIKGFAQQFDQNAFVIRIV